MMADGESGDAAGWFETVGAVDVHDGYSRVRIEQVRTPDGQVVEREIVDHDDAVAVVALNHADEVILLRQYRQPFRAYVLEIPAGTLDVAGEEPHDAAARELAEEAQHRAEEFEDLGAFYNSAGWTNEKTHLYLARSVMPVAPPRGFVAEAEEADMEVVLLPFDEVVAMARAGRLPDAKSLIGVLLAAERLGR